MLWAILIVVFLASAAGLTFYLRPIVVITQIVRLQLFRAGVSSRYTSLPYQSRSYRIHYYVAGQGPTVLLIHGIGGSGENWAGLIPAIARAGFRVYAPDLLGFGRSERPDVDYSIALQAELMQAFLRRMHEEKVTIGGVSMGGWVALRIAARNQSELGRLLLIDTAGTRFAPTFSPALFEPRSVDQLQTLIDHLMPHAPKLPEYIGRDMLRSAAPTGWVIQRAMESMFTGRDLMDTQLLNFSVPTLLLWGREDQVIPVRTGELLHEQIRNSQLQVFDGCGHLLLEACGPKITKPVIDFLRGNGSR